MQTTYAHRTALQAEDPENLVGFTRYGWGARVTLVKPQRGKDPRIPEAIEVYGPGCWFYLPGLVLFDTTSRRISDLPRMALAK
jgi:hypothetical protein